MDLNKIGVNVLLIDKITSSIEDVKTGISYDTDVLPVTINDLKLLLKKNGWQFNWRSEFKYADRSLFKLVLKGSSIIQGIISLQPIENYIELHLIETAPHNYGKSKKYLGVPANLVAFACKLSFDQGFDGVVAFKAKTKLINHYKEKLGAKLLFRDRMSISGNSAKNLVNSYYKNYLND